jgi:hypothetical protein
VAKVPCPNCLRCPPPFGVAAFLPSFLNLHPAGLPLAFHCLLTFLPFSVTDPRLQGTGCQSPGAAGAAVAEAAPGQSLAHGHIRCVCVSPPCSIHTFFPSPLSTPLSLSLARSYAERTRHTVVLWLLGRVGSSWPVIPPVSDATHAICSQMRNREGEW